jgi:gas vesicle protein
MSTTGQEERDTRESAMDAEGGNGKARTFAAGLILGALVGAGLALLLAPQSGADTRRDLARRARRLGNEARDRYDEAKRRVRRAREHRQDLKDEATAE